VSGDEEQHRFEADLILRAPDEDDAATHVTADREGLALNHVRFATSAQILGSATEQIRDDGQCRLTLFINKDGLRQKTILMLPNRKSAQELVQALGVAAEQRTLELRFRQKWSVPEEYLPWAGGFFAVGLCLCLSICSLLPTYTILAFAILMSAVAVFRVHVTRTSIVIGSDGILRRRFLRTRFARFDEISRVIRKDGGIFLELRDGGAVRLIRRSANSAAELPWLRIYAELVERRIEEGTAAHHASQIRRRTDHPLARGGREVKAWLEELRAHERSTSAYRSVAVPEAMLDGAFADGSLDAETRVGSAIALRVREGERAVPRLRLAAAATASPKLRVALEKIADGAPDEEIARRIEKLR
jgi:hypothetical protein